MYGVISSLFAASLASTLLAPPPLRLLSFLFLSSLKHASFIADQLHESSVLELPSLVSSRSSRKRISYKWPLPGHARPPHTMHFALPPRKTSRPPPYAARQQNGFRIPPALKNLLRRDKLRLVVFGILGFLTVFWLLRKIGGGSSNSKAPNLPRVAVGSGAPVVIVTVLDPQADPAWTAKIKHNREEYAKRHGMNAVSPYSAGLDIDTLQATRPSSPTVTNTPSAAPLRPGPASPPCATP